MTAEPRRSLPPRPDLGHQKKLAKELLRAIQSGDASALERVREQLPDKTSLTLADAQYVLAREYGFANWAALKAHIEATRVMERLPLDQFRKAFERCDAAQVKQLLKAYPEAKSVLDEPMFAFGGTALIHAASHGAMDLVDVLIDAGADPNRRSDWWAGPFHVLHSVDGAMADRLIARGAVPDACAAARIDRVDLLRDMLRADPRRVHERGGDGQTPLHFARSRAVVDLLLEHGADPDVRDVDHRSTPAQWMLEGRRGAGRYDLARYLVECGATPDIFLAAALGLTDRVRDMLRADASLLDLRTTRGEYGEKPPSSFHIYMWTIGANLSPQQVAAQFEQHAVLDVMQEFGTPRQRFLAACAAARSEEARALVRDRPTLVSELSPEDQRVLPDAGWAGNADAVGLMLELGFDPLTPGQDTGTVLHCAAWQGEAAAVRTALRHPGVRALVNHREATHHSTPLGWCAHGSVHCRNVGGDYPAVARELLAAGAKVGPETAEASPEVRAILDAGRAG
ncbi:MAG: ankyrin repeat domain-containing protein [Longimicrobiales bacterium]